MALSCGKPVIASQTPGFQELLKHKHNALLVPAGDAEPLAGSIDVLLGDSTLARELGRQARALAERTLTWSSVARITFRIYDGLS